MADVAGLREQIINKTGCLGIQWLLGQWKGKAQGAESQHGKQNEASGCDPMDTQLCSEG